MRDYVAEVGVGLLGHWGECCSCVTVRVGGADVFLDGLGY